MHNCGAAGRGTLATLVHCAITCTMLISIMVCAKRHRKIRAAEIFIRTYFVVQACVCVCVAGVCSVCAPREQCKISVIYVCKWMWAGSATSCPQCRMQPAPTPALSPAHPAPACPTYSPRMVFSADCFIIMCLRFTKTIAPNESIMMASMTPSRMMNHGCVNTSFT